MSDRHRSRTGGTVLAFAAMLGACAQSSGATQVTQPPPKPQRAAVEVQEAKLSFTQWQAQFRERALAAGIRQDVIDTAFQGVRANQNVRSLDSKQPEFSRPIWEYLDSAVGSR